MQESAQCFVDIDQLTTCWTEHIESQRVKENSLVDKTRVACKLYPGQMILKYCRNTTLTNQENTAHIYILRMLRYHSFYKANYSLRPASSINIICCQTATKLKLSKCNFWCNSEICRQRSMPIQCCTKFRISEPSSFS